jgi:hypothetical protein
MVSGMKPKTIVNVLLLILIIPLMLVLQVVLVVKLMKVSTTLILYQKVLETLIMKSSNVLNLKILGMIISGVLDIVLKELTLLIVHVLLVTFKSKQLHGINGVIVTTVIIMILVLMLVLNLPMILLLQLMILLIQLPVLLTVLLVLIVLLA